MLKRNKIYTGDCRELLKQLDDDSIDCFITSPPYWSLRDYGIPSSIWDGDPNCDHIWTDHLSFNILKEPVFCVKCNAWYGVLGFEPNFDLFIKHLCDIYDLVMEKMKKTGTCYVNLGDSYGTHSSGTSTKQMITTERKPLKNFEKCLLLIPQRFAIEMVNRGWILRNVIIWHKPNCMPSSAKDRYTVDFEYVYFFVKNKKYWFEQQREQLSQKKATQDRYKYAPATNADVKNDGSQKGVNPSNAYNKYWCENLPKNENTLMSYTENDLRLLKNQNEVEYRKKLRSDKKYDAKEPYDQNFPYQGNNINGKLQGRAKRCVWTINTKPNKEAHFATFPPKLVEPMILSGCPEFICNKCGKARKKIMRNTEEYDNLKEKWNHINMGGNIKTGKNRKTGYPGHITKEQTFEGYTDCGCNAGFKPGIVLDPFAGTGTTLKTAFNLGRDYLGFEISEEYVNKIAKKFLSSTKNKRLTEFL